MTKVILVAGFLAALSACSTEENARSRGDSVRGGAGGSGEPAEAASEAASGGAAAGGQRADAGNGGAVSDAGTCQRGADGPDVSDVSLRARYLITYAGLVTVETGDGGGLLLLPTQDGGQGGVTFDGTVPPVSPGATLWASFRQVDPMRTNPFARRVVWHHVVRTSENGHILAEDLRDFMDEASSLTFLGAPISLEKLCSADPPPDFVDGGLHYSFGCIGVSRYAVTIHGETDLSLTDHTSGHVTVGGIDYTVSANGALEDYFVLDTTNRCSPDQDRSPRLALVARVTRYQDVLPPAADSGL
jgi:hypothetical protein